jgi:hypothetical protein
MKVRIKAAPREREMDGINLGIMQPGTVREVSAAIGTWLIVEGYAEPEMRHPPPEHEGQPTRSRSIEHDRRRR